MTRTATLAANPPTRTLSMAVAEPTGLRTFHGLVGRAPAMQTLFASVRRFAPHARIALITGETGTGKGLLARTLYQLGPGRGGPFVEIRCAAAMNAESFSSRLNPGEPSGEAGTGGGTIFLDDIDELPRALQSSLLALMESADGRSAEPACTGVQVIAATGRELQTEVIHGRFRSELLYRLNAFELRMPPLRERLDDIEALASVFMQDIAKRLARPTVSVTPGAARLLQTMPWPGNLRELRNVLERACILSDDDTVDEGDIRAALVPVHPPMGPGSGVLGATAHEGNERLEDAQRAHVRAVLNRAHGNKSIAARQLGISRRALYRLMDRLRS